MTMADSELNVKNEQAVIVSNTLSLKDRITGNRNAVIGSVIAVILIVTGVWYYRSVQAEKSAEASLALSRIMPYVEAGDIQKALQGDPTKKVRGNDIIGLIAIVDQYESTEAGKTAALHAANAQLSTKNFSEAERLFDIATGSSSPFVKASAQAGMASTKEAQNQFSDAASLYEKAVAMSEESGNKDKYQYYAALCYEKAGNKESAKTMYENLLAEFEFSEFAGEAKAGLTRIGMVVD